MRKVLFIGAHPDDVIVGIGGMILHHLRKNDLVTELVLSKGTNNILNWNIPKNNRAKIRVKEEYQAANVLGKFKTIFFDFEDHKVINSPELRETLKKTFNEIRPHIVYVPAPKKNITWYTRDHVRTGQAVTHVAKELNNSFELRYYMTTNITKLQGLNPDDEALIEKALFEYESQKLEINFYLQVRRFFLRKWGKTLNKQYAEGWCNAKI